MSAFYNEHDPSAAAWLRSLIAEGLIAPGVVDERDIRDIRPFELEAYTQCHFFAGIGGWSLALRLAGWPDARPIWTGSCPCQPFSAAGRGLGFTDERHLWPAFYHLVDQCHPDVVTGEQVASKDGLAWLDLVYADLEGTGFGAPHIRQRLWWLANADNNRRQGRRPERPGTGSTLPPSLASGLADAAAIGHTLGRLGSRDPGDEPRSGAALVRRDGPGVVGLADGNGWPPRGRASAAVGQGRAALATSGAGRLDDAGGLRWGASGHDHAGHVGVVPDAAGQPIAVGDAGRPGLPAREREELRGAGGGPEGRATEQPGRAPWADADWIHCRDGKWRPIEPGSFPLAHGIPGRGGGLRGYWNRISPTVAPGVIKAFLDAERAGLAPYDGVLS